MEYTGMSRILAFSAILAVGTGLAGSKTAASAAAADPVRPGAYRQETGEAGRAKEDKTDCDDCVIVRRGSEEPSGESVGILAGTLWGLFLVRRPRRMPRAIIRGVTVP